MPDDVQIKKWLKEGVITKAQARKMLVDTEKDKKAARSDKLIVAISTIGAILLGIGAILFVASNWQVIPDIGKTLLLISSTFGAYALGFVFKYHLQNLPKVGSSLIFLGALLFGATIILIAQIYHLPANTHVLVLLWLVGIVPLVYVLNNEALAGLAALLYFLWIGLFFSPQDTWLFFVLLGPLTLVLFILASLALFACAGLHYLNDSFPKIARAYRITALKVAMVSLFLLTFSSFSQASSFMSRISEQMPSHLIVGIVLLAVIAIVLFVINVLFNSSKKVSVLEAPIGLGIIAAVMIFYFYPSETSIYVLMFNMLFVGMISVLIYVGYQREDIKLVNIGMSWLSVFIVVRYFDFFWELLPRSLFFIVGGVILMLGGIALEKKRRQIKKEFGTA